MQPKLIPPAETPKARILVVDDHPLVCEGMTDLIDRQPDLFCCARAYNAADARAATATKQPDLVLMDLRLGQTDGLQLIEDLKLAFPSISILVLSQLDELIYAERALRAGALGYVMKAQATDELLRAIRSVLSGQVYVSQRVTTLALRRLVEDKPRISGPNLGALTDRELHVFKQIGQGKSTREIAAGLNLSIKTIETYREHLKYKLGLANSAELVHCAHEWLDEADSPDLAAIAPSHLPAPPSASTLFATRTDH